MQRSGLSGSGRERYISQLPACGRIRKFGNRKISPPHIDSSSGFISGIGRCCSAARAYSARTNSPPSVEPAGIALPRSDCSTRSEEHTSELQSLMRISYAVFCLKKKKHRIPNAANQNSRVLRQLTDHQTEIEQDYKTPKHQH